MRGILVLLLIVLALFGSVSPVDAQTPVTITIRGPSAVAPSSTHSYSITVAGGPAAEHGGTYQIEFILQGDNLVGASPLTSTLRSNEQGRFDENVTAPEAEGAVILYVKATSQGDENRTAEARYPIDVFRPVDLRATIKNNGAAAALNVTVFFFVDNVPVGNATASRIDAGGAATVNVTYIPVNLAPGRHSVRVQADLDGDGRFTVEAGELVAYDFFYKTPRTNVPAIFATLTALILLILLFLLLAIRRRRRQGG